LPLRQKTSPAGCRRAFLKQPFFEKMNLIPKNHHTDWNPFLKGENLLLIKEIGNKLNSSEFTPPAEKVLRFLTLPLQTARIVILGQDPYPQPGVATGRAFEVGTLRSWNEPFSNISLKNILRAVYKAYSGEIIRYTELKAKFDNEFPVLPPNLFFENWEKQGVLLLNTSFTCELNSPGSHRKYWEQFSGALFSFINEANPELTWFLWGNHAQQATAHLDLQHTVRSHHPMMCVDREGKEEDFLYGNQNGFARHKNQVDWTGFAGRFNERRPSTLF